MEGQTSSTSQQQPLQFPNWTLYFKKILIENIFMESKHLNKEQSKA